jgi:hypothetical protein
MNPIEFSEQIAYMNPKLSTLATTLEILAVILHLTWIFLRTHTSLSSIRRGFAPGFVNYKMGALDSQSQVIKFTSYLPMVGGSLRLLPPLKAVTIFPSHKVPIAVLLVFHC